MCLLPPKPNDDRANYNEFDILDIAAYCKFLI